MPIKTTERFDAQYERLSPILQDKIKKAVSFLDIDFRHPGLRSHPVKGYEGIHEAYVDEKYRMTYERRGDVLILRNVDNHDECLKNH
jgi:hypothetical protein